MHWSDIMRVKMIPPIGTKGLYKLEVPYNALIREAEVYECGAIRYFTDLENANRNVFKLYYEPYGLSQQDYNRDKQDGHVLITLLSAVYPPVYVPSSYIRSYPSLENKSYSQVILTASLGALPDDVILEPTIAAMQNAISEYIGVEVEVHVGTMPISTAVTPEEHETREASRLGAIANLESDYAKLAQVENLNMELQQRVVLLEQVIKNNGLLN